MRLPWPCPDWGDTDLTAGRHEDRRSKTRYGMARARLDASDLDGLLAEIRDPSHDLWATWAETVVVIAATLVGLKLGRTASLSSMNRFEPVPSEPTSPIKTTGDSDRRYREIRDNRRE